MGLGDLFKAKENERLKSRISDLEAMLTPEMRDSIALQEKIIQQKAEIDALQEQFKNEEQRQRLTVDEHQTTLRELENEIKKVREILVETNEEALMQSFGLYEPKFDFANSTKYKEALEENRASQKGCIKAGAATTKNTGWTVNGDKRKGDKMIRDMQKLLLRAFNTECDDVIARVKFNNIESAEKRIRTSCKTISQLGAICSVSIRDLYCDLKIDELHLAYEYQVEKQKEKEQLKQLRAEERERAKLEKEIQEARKKIEKEQKHYANALAKINQQIATASPEELSALKDKKAELEGALGDLGKSMEQIDYRAANQKAGYVYVISNVGAFGEGIYKIGMTRRLEPMDRIDELGDASVPFDFDVHALIFSDNAPALEAALHQAFSDRKLNMINTRREFFRVSLEEIKKVVQQNYDKTVEFIDIPPAEQYRQSELMRNLKI